MCRITGFADELYGTHDSDDPLYVAQNNGRTRVLSEHAGLPVGMQVESCDTVPLNGLFAAYFPKIGPNSLVMLGNRMRPDLSWSAER